MSDARVEIERLLLAAIGLPDHERTAWVNEHASSDDIAREVLSLIQAHERTGVFDALIEEQDTRDAVRTGPLEPGSRLGAWEIVGELGRGGMGVVYRARRADGQYEQDAALKILTADLRGSFAETRFFAERQILAGLSHPAIARLLDGGLSEDGRPFFVMEIVDGIPIDRYCDGHHLELAARLRLFLSVCAAVQYAHENLIVHRDLKPSNILVTKDGSVRLLDFGIAKLLADEAATPSGSGDDARLLTPEYASPEQLLGQRITTASDVFQLGVLLYLLVAGRHPFDGDERKRTDGTLADPRIVPPSRTVRSEPGVAGRLHTGLPGSPARMARRLSGDIDAIVAKALREEPDRRYRTAGQLADDVRRHLERRPVEARPATASYRAGRFLRRNWPGAAITAGAFLLIGAFAAGIAREARRTARERDRAEAVIDFLVGLFESADPYSVRGDTLRVRDVLDRGATRIRSELAGQPAVQASLMYVIADVYGSLGLYDQAVPLMHDALALRRAELDPSDPDLARTMIRLVQYHAISGHPDDVDSLFPEALRQFRTTMTPGTDDWASGLNDLGYARLVRGDYEGAEPLLEEAVRAFDAGEPRSGLGAALTNLGQIRRSKGDLDSALILLHRSVSSRRSLGAAGQPRLASSLESLAEVLVETDSLDAAEAAAGEALTIQRTLLPDGHPSLAGPISIQANILRRRGRPADAEPLLREVLRIRRTALGEDHFAVADARNTLGLALQAQGRNSEAETLFRSALDGYRAQFGDDHPNPAVVELNLARLLQRTNQLEKARTRFEHAIPILRRAFPGDRTYVGDLVSLGLVYCRSNLPELTESTLREAADLLRPPDGGRAPDDYLRALNALGSCLFLAGRNDAAAEILRESLDASAERPDGDPYRAFALQIVDNMRRARR